MSFVAEFDDEEINKWLQSLSGKLKQINGGQKKLVALLSAIVFKDVMEHFDNEDGETLPWEHWSNSYQKHMDRIGKSGNKILQFKGRLRNNFKPSKNRVADGSITWFNDAKTKNGFPYAFAHNEGGNTLPQRDFMWASDDAVEKMADQTLMFLLDEDIKWL